MNENITLFISDPFTDASPVFVSCAIPRPASSPLPKEATAIVGVNPSHLRRDKDEWSESGIIGMGDFLSAKVTKSFSRENENLAAGYFLIFNTFCRAMKNRSLALLIVLSATK